MPLPVSVKQVFVFLIFLIADAVSERSNFGRKDDVSLVLHEIGEPHRAYHAGTRHKRDTSNSGQVKMTDLQIVSTIQSHYARTVITSIMENRAVTGNGTEISFFVQLPEEAFISSFVMLINGTWYASKVLPKAEANKIYENATKQGQNAGMVSSAGYPPETLKYRKRFSVNTNVAPESSVTFVLTYEGLLVRKLGNYQHIISVRPNQTVANLTVAVDIDEPQGVTSLEVAEPSLPQSSVQSLSSNVKKIHYSPTVAQQQANNVVTGIEGDFNITYQLQDTNDGGKLIVGAGGYFAQYIAPKGLPAIPKNVYFVVDISGSMGGQKIEQARNAMLAILDQLDQSADYFGIVLFDDELEYWPDPLSLVQATSERISSAKAFAREKIKARGGTDINSGLVAASQALKNQLSSRSSAASIAVFLTDGQPTSGVSNTTLIRQNILRETSGTGIGIFSIGFGTGVNEDFMKAVSRENCGKYKFIANDADASKELQDFFSEVGTPVIKTVQVTYSSSLVELSSLSDTTKCFHFSGSEEVVVGKLLQPSCPSSWQSRVTGQGKTSAVDLYSSVATCTNEMFLERLWAYKKINTLLDQINVLSDNDVLKKDLEAKALNMSLEYNFVTPLTSMVVVQSADYQYTQEDALGRMFGGKAGFPTGSSANTLQTVLMAYLCTILISLYSNCY